MEPTSTPQSPEQPAPSLPAPSSRGAQQPSKLACSECGKQFGAAESLEQHRIAKHTSQPSSASSPVKHESARRASPGGKRSYKKYAVVGVVFLILVYGYMSMGSSPSADLNGLKCESMEGTVIHIHPNLKIFVGGAERVLPSNIGIRSSCMYWLHTHDSTGVIHVESPISRTFTLGDFLKVWNATQRDTLPFTPGAPASLVIVDGRNYTGSYESIIFQDGQQIELHFP